MSWCGKDEERTDLFLFAELEQQSVHFLPWCSERVYQEQDHTLYGTIKYTLHHHYTSNEHTRCEHVSTPIQAGIYIFK